MFDFHDFERVRERTMHVVATVPSSPPLHGLTEEEVKSRSIPSVAADV